MSTRQFASSLVADATGHDPTEAEYPSSQGAGRDLRYHRELAVVMAVTDSTKEGPILGGDVRLHQAQATSRIERSLRAAN
jgi:hypothetical protein